MKKRNLKIQNIVATASLKTRIPLTKLLSLPNTEYNPEQFPGLIHRPKNLTFLIFSSGDLVCTGAKNKVQLKKEVNYVIRELRKIGIKVQEEPKITVQNIVASGSINMNLNLNKLAIQLENTEYEPEQFPGLVHKIPELNSTFLLFSNGKIVCTGTKTRRQLKKAVKQLVKNVKEAMSKA